MSAIQSKITWHAKKQENHEKKQSIETDSALTWVFELIDENMKTVIINVFHMSKKLNRDMKDIKRRSKSNF